MAKFQKGNPGKPKGAIAKKNRAFGVICRELLEAEDDDGITFVAEVVHDIRRLRPTTFSLKLKLDLVEFLTAYGYGKPPQKVVLDSEDTSPDGILRRLMAERNEKLRTSGPGKDAGEAAGD